MSTKHRLAGAMTSRLSIGYILMASTAVCASAQAQSTGVGDTTSSGTIEEITVTAQKRSESLQDVPIAVSAVTAAQLARAGITDVADIKYTVPSLNLVDSAGYLNTSLRGIGSNGIGAGIENPIALYIDGIYYGSPAASLLTLNNISQIEVLKGPQGTLFGRNATGGLIQIATKDPGPATSGSANLRYGNYNTVSGDGYLSGGLLENLFADFAISGTRQGTGWGHNFFNNDDVYKVDRDLAARTKWIYAPVGGTKLTFIADYSNHIDSGEAYRVFPGTISGFTPAAGPVPGIGYNTDTDTQPHTTTSGGGFSLRWDQSLDDLNFASISAYRRSNVRFIFDYDGSPDALESIDEVQRDNQLSQEFQLSSSAGPLTWLVGAYWFDAHSEINPFVLTANDLGAEVTVVNHQRTQSGALYGQVTYEILDQTHLTMGGRYTKEKRSAYDGSTGVFVIPLALQVPPTIGPDLHQTFDKPTYRVSLDHRFSDQVLAYVSYNRGFKSGGYNTSTPGTEPFQPETLDAYEVGLKTDLADRRVRLDVAGFYYRYRDIQIQQLNAGAITIINGASAKDYGIDSDLTVQLTEAFRLTGGLSWISPTFNSFPDCPISTPLGGTPSVLGSCAGNQLPLAPKVSSSLGGTYAYAIGPGSLEMSSTLFYSSGFFPESDNVIKQGGYTMLSVSANYIFNNKFSIGAYGKNLTDRQIINFETTIPNGTHTGFYQAPRTYGVMFGYKF